MDFSRLTQNQLEQTHKTLVLSELQQIVIDTSFIKEQSKTMHTQRSNSHRLGTHNIQPQPLQWNITGYNMLVSAALKRIPDTMQTIHQVEYM